MNSVMKRVQHECTPQFNKNVMDGTAKWLLREGPDYINTVYSHSIKSLSPGIELKYIGYRLLTPKEKVVKMINSKGADPITNYDIAHNDVYPIEIMFEYSGQPLNIQIDLPFAARGNLIMLSDTMYHIVPIMTDSVITPMLNGIFVRLLMAKLSFKPLIRNYMINGEKVPKTMIHCQVLRVNKAQIVDNIGKPLVPTALYPVAKYGYKQALSRYANINNSIITCDPVSPDMYEEYMVYTTTGIKPKWNKIKLWIPHTISILIPRDELNGGNIQFAEMLSTGLLYAFDMCLEDPKEIVGYINDKELPAEMMYWKVLLGRLSYKNSYSVTRMYGDILEHFVALEGYIDSLLSRKLSESGKDVKDFFDLVYNILNNFVIWTVNSKEHNSSVDNRYIDYFYYIYYDIIVAFNRAILNMNKRASRKVLSFKEINKIITGEIPPKIILGLTKSSSQNLAINLAETSCDMYYTRITSLLENQNRGNGVVKGGKIQLPESTKTIKGDSIIFGSMFFLGKQTPSPEFKFNPFVNYDVYTGKVIFTKKQRELVNMLDNMLAGKEENTGQVDITVTDNDNDLGKEFGMKVDID